MKEINNIVRAATRVILARRDARRAVEDGASESAQKKYAATFSQALDELEKSLEALAKVPKRTTPSAPFDWLGAARAVQAVVRVARKVKRGAPVEDVIDAEVIG